MERSKFLFPLMILFLHSLMSCTAKKVTNITTDEAALLALKTNISSDSYKILQKSWSTSASVCDWIGVFCNSSGGRGLRVAALNLSGFGLFGTVPSQIGDLSVLVSLDLSMNNFSGNLPQELANLQQLEVIVLSYNRFSGQIPPWFGSFPELRRLVLRNNSFTGPIPDSIANLTKLENLILSSNLLNGKIPKRIGDLYSLKTVGLAGNQLSGSIPSEIFSISSLEGIDLARNNLSGDLPSDMCRSIPRIKALSLTWNSIGGEIPLSISNCSELVILSLSYNKFGGAIPGEIGKLVMLEQLYLGGNSFSKGEIPQEFSNLQNLKMLGLERTQRVGSIPPTLFNISGLQGINLCSNFLKGEIPEEIGNLYQLEIILLCNNSLSGPIPRGMFNISTLTEITLARNQLSGTLPLNMGNGLPNLEFLNLFENNIGGILPVTLSNSSRLRAIRLSYNEFTGPIPDSLGDLSLLEILELHTNNLTRQSSSQELSFITALTKCRYLREISVNGNPLNGIIPASIGNLSSLEKFYAYECHIRGSIPNEIGNLSKLIQLSLSDNHLIGPIPATMKAIQVIYLENNNIGSSNLSNICELKNLWLIKLSNNQISGPIPDCLGNVTSLRYLNLAQNKLTSLPLSIWKLTNLLELRLFSNSLNGTLPSEIGNMNILNYMDLSMNQFSGDIPSVFGDLSSLQYLDLHNNSFSGSIPGAMGKTLTLEFLDLSHNNLSGLIPKSLEELMHLISLNVSFNNLRGEIPSEGPFTNFTSQSFMFNDALCGDSRFQVPPCPASPTQRRKSRKVLRLVFIPVGVAAILLSIAMILVLMRWRRKGNVASESDLLPSMKLERISYYELLEATDRYSESNLLGSGGFGSVYKGILKDGSLVAVKVFNLQLENASNSFETECEALRNLRHRNLTKVISSCCNEEFKALVLQYMPNGSLEKWLYSYNYFMDLIQRLNIMIDVASSLEYLHYGNSTPLAHCDLKPSNVLLDQDMIAHLTDFGIAKLLSEGNSISHTTTLATMGYIAPEFGLEGLVSIRCDVYSFGIMMMEVFSRKRPSDEMFAADLSLKQWVSKCLPNSVVKIADSNLLNQDEENFTKKLKCVSSIMELALNCSAESPNDRINIKDALAALKKIKLEYLADGEGA